MSSIFREFVRKIGSGSHTGKNLTREEAMVAARMMLLQEATPAQIGAFLIAHRIKRPTGEELAGMLDAYDQLGPKLQPIAANHPVLVLGCPYDGRSRTTPLAPLTALILAAADCPVILHGGRRMPTKQGEPLVQTWQALGVNWLALPLADVQTVLARTGIGFVYVPQHFPHADGLVVYRDEIGKRPPLATLELMWCPYAGAAHVVSGFVHPPTEEMIKTCFALRGVNLFTLVKGLEGSCDLPRDRTAIIGLGDPVGFTRLHLSPYTYGFGGKNTSFDGTSQPATLMAVLQGQPSDLFDSVVWNSGFYLWRSGVCAHVTSGIEQARRLLVEGAALAKLEELRGAIADVTVPSAVLTAPTPHPSPIA